MKQITIILFLLLSANVYAQPTDFLTVNIAYPFSFDTTQVDERQLLFHANHKPKKLICKKIKIASLGGLYLFKKVLLKEIYFLKQVNTLKQNINMKWY